jgi:hypothetical protein
MNTILRWFGLRSNATVRRLELILQHDRLTHVLRRLPPSVTRTRAAAELAEAEQQLAKLAA